MRRRPYSLGSGRPSPIARSSRTETWRLAGETGQLFVWRFPDVIDEHWTESFPADTHQHTGASHQALHAVDLQTNIQGEGFYQNCGLDVEIEAAVTLRPSAVYSLRTWNAITSDASSKKAFRLLMDLLFSTMLLLNPGSLFFTSRIRRGLYGMRMWPGGVAGKASGRWGRRLWWCQAPWCLPTSSILIGLTCRRSEQR